MGVITAYCPICKIIARIEVIVSYVGDEKITKYRCLKCGRTVKTDNEKRDDLICK